MHHAAARALFAGFARWTVARAAYRAQAGALHRHALAAGTVAADGDPHVCLVALVDLEDPPGVHDRAVGSLGGEPRGSPTRHGEIPVSRWTTPAQHFPLNLE